MSNSLIDTIGHIADKEQLHQEQILELYWHVTCELANADTTLISIKRQYDFSMNLLRAVKYLKTLYSSLELLKNDFKNSAHRKASLFVISLYKQNRTLGQEKEKLPATATIWKAFNTTRALNDFEYRTKLAEHLRAFIDKMSPMVVDLEGLTYLKYHSCCGCDTHDIPPKGLFLFNYKGMSVPLCNECWVAKKVNDKLVFNLMLNYIKRIELTNNVLSGTL